jgi:hypothetical protein
MKMRIHCFIPFGNKQQVESVIASLRASPIVDKIYLLSCGECKNCSGEYEIVSIDRLQSTRTVRKIAALSDTDYTLIYTKVSEWRLGLFALDRMIRIAQDSCAGLVYADHYRITNGEKIDNPLISYQKGSLRDDFDFGPVLIYRASALKEAVSRMDKEYKFAGLYDLRLKVSQKFTIEHINEYLYSETENNICEKGEKQFDYVNPQKREVQIEMEAVCTEHLKVIGGYLAPSVKEITFDAADFETEASVIIPVHNRVQTIADAISSALSQKTNFKFNLLVVDNYSTDGTTEIINQFTDNRLIHIIPDNKDLGIGGCWNTAIFHPRCGKFVVQLDSDDEYADENTLQKIIDAFYIQKCAMLTGSYQLMDFKKNVIPPGIIDHREWTPQNGQNNALRINGLGAPRAFYTPLLRQIKVPNTSYGEDYALGLYFSREYSIGRIYDVLYLCRRWSGNSDASISTEKVNAHNTYKDRIRTWELNARIQLNKKTIKQIQ